MSNITTDTYPESIDSYHPPTPPTFHPSHLAPVAPPRGAPDAHCVTAAGVPDGRRIRSELGFGV
ncbi:hypothetical protein E2562_014232 [Oryza meyeriana var. granulata]|uniref:Uncharacterized protein n=1 Tax=Oryza meyeriana var. granulata TaxID=110450 RepID=A0A6G1BKI8_9ORYZ|nr:hypothetical protein E2562_014232 [Oryza meyeriana var. granulata]